MEGLKKVFCKTIAPMFVFFAVVVAASYLLYLGIIDRWVLKEFFFKIIAPMIWLFLLAYVFTSSSIKLVEAWKAKKFNQLWSYVWVILISLYFLIHRG